MNKILNSLIVLLVLICGSAATTSAQLPGSCWHYGTGIPYPSWPGAFNCEPSGFGNGFICMFWNTGGIVCPPAAGRNETVPGSKCPHCSSPISLSNGNTYIEENDVRIPGLAGGLTLSRTWNSMWPPSQIAFQKGLFGPNWRSTYEERIFMGSDNYIKYARSDGSFWSFVGGGTLVLITPGNVNATLTVNSANTQWILTFQNGEQRIFSYTSGSLQSIIDRNGNTTQLTYDSLNRLTTVTDPVGRHLYFGYPNNSSLLVTSVTSDVGISLSYAYDSSGRLVQVTEPDLTTLSYQYGANSMIGAVIDSNGKVLESHSYDYCDRGVTGARAGGIESVTLSYPSPACPGSQTVYFESEP